MEGDGAGVDGEERIDQIYMLARRGYDGKMGRLTVSFVDDDDLVGKIDAERLPCVLLQQKIVR